MDERVDEGAKSETYGDGEDAVHAEQRHAYIVHGKATPEGAQRGNDRWRAFSGTVFVDMAIRSKGVGCEKVIPSAERERTVAKQLQTNLCLASTSRRVTQGSPTI